MTDYTKLEEMESVNGIYNCIIQFRDEQAPIGDMFVTFKEALSPEKAYDSLLNVAIRNGVLNILNSLSEVKGFHAYSDYIVVLGLQEGIEKVKQELNRTFEFYLKQVTQEEYEKELKIRAEDAKAEQAEAEEAAGILEEETPVKE